MWKNGSCVPRKGNALPTTQGLAARGGRQPEATRRAYAQQLGVPLHELGLETEAVAVEKARSERSDEIEVGLARCSSG